MPRNTIFKHILIPLILLLSGFTSFATPRPALAASQAMPGEVVVRFTDATSLTPTAQAIGQSAESTNALLRQLQAGAAFPIDAEQQTYRVRVRDDLSPQQVAERLRRLPTVLFAEPNFQRTLFRTTNDPEIARQWSLQRIQAPEAWDISTGVGIPIAVLDTGVSPTHPELAGRILPGFDFVNLDEDPRDDQGHGTFIAGIIAAAGDNDTGIAGLCWGCLIMPVKVLNNRGLGDDATIAAGIRWAADHGARIISMSLGGPRDTRVIREAIQYAYSMNVVLVAASGNSGDEGGQINYPAAYPEVLAVTASDANDQVASFSTIGNLVDLSAPGSDVFSSVWRDKDGDTYTLAQGTSVACPHVAGAAGLILSMRGDLAPSQVYDILRMSADDIGTAGVDSESGYGRLNLFHSLQNTADPNLTNRSEINGVVRGMDPQQVVMTLNTGQQTTPDANGNYGFTGLPAGNYTVQASALGAETVTQQTSVSGIAISKAWLEFSIGLGNMLAFAPVPHPGNEIAFYPATQHTLRGEFRNFWERNGGLSIFGYPISEEFIEIGDDGKPYTVQYFERHRLEYHPELQPPYTVQLTRLGDLMLKIQNRDWFSFPTATPQPNCRLFEETHHSICGDFLNYWNNHGLDLDGKRGFTDQERLALFGMPLSEPQLEQLADGSTYTVQWFERVRMEDHGANGGILLGLLANDIAHLRGWR